jgi:hypothetical protein
VSDAKLENFRLSEIERAMLAELAEASGLSKTDVVRLEIRRAHSALVRERRRGSAAPVKKTRRK